MAGGLDFTTVLLVIVAVIAAVFIAKGLRIVQQSEAMVIERLGSYNRTLTSGVNWIIPFVDKPRAIKVKRYLHKLPEPVVLDEIRIDRRETVLDFPRQPVVTRDNVTVQINGALYFQIIDPSTAVYAVENLVQAVEILAKTSLRSEVGKMELDQIFESREEINARLQTTMDEAGDKWGVKVTRVEIQDIDIPPEVEDAMRTQMVAERSRRAAVTEAEGKKRAAILEAEGDKEAAVLRADGQREAIQRVLLAAEDKLQPEDAVSYLLALEYLETLPDIAKKGERVFLPYEASALLGSLGMMGSLLGNGGGAGTGGPAGSGIPRTRPGT